jgi:hypothetical protein
MQVNIALSQSLDPDPQGPVRLRRQSSGTLISAGNLPAPEVERIARRSFENVNMREN